MSNFDAKDAEQYSYMSMQAYQNNGGVPPDGFKVLADTTSLGIGADTGYYGVAYQNIEHPEQIVIANRGTELAKDFVNDAAIADVWEIGRDKIPEQFNDALAFTNQVSAMVGIPVSDITQTGHSLGGAISNLLSVATDAFSYSFNAPGIADLLPQLETMNGVEPGTYQNVDHSQITSYILAGDPVHSWGTQIGNTVTVDNPGLQREADIHAQFIEGQSMAAFPDLAAINEAAQLTMQDHSINYFHAVLQDDSAVSRMGPIYGEPTPEQPVDHIPSKAEWADGTGFQHLVGEQPPAQNPPDVTQTVNEALPPNVVPTVDAKSPVPPVDGATTSTTDQTYQYLSSANDAFLTPLTHEQEKAYQAYLESFSRDNFSLSGSQQDPLTRAEWLEARNELKDALSTTIATIAGISAIESLAHSDEKSPTSLPDAFAATAAPPATPDAFAGVGSSPPAEQPAQSLPDAFANLQSAPPADVPNQPTNVFDSLNNTSPPPAQTPLPDAFAATGESRQSIPYDVLPTTARPWDTPSDPVPPPAPVSDSYVAPRADTNWQSPTPPEPPAEKSWVSDLFGGSHTPPADHDSGRSSSWTESTPHQDTPKHDSWVNQVSHDSGAQSHPTSNTPTHDSNPSPSHNSDSSNHDSGSSHDHGSGHGHDSSGAGMGM